MLLKLTFTLLLFFDTIKEEYQMFQTKDEINLKTIIMEASKRPAENGSNGDSTDAKKAKLDPDCGALLFCGTTEWQNVKKSKLLIFVIFQNYLCRH